MRVILVRRQSRTSQLVTNIVVRVEWNSTWQSGWIECRKSSVSPTADYAFKSETDGHVSPTGTASTHACLCICRCVCVVAINDHEITTEALSSCIMDSFAAFTLLPAQASSRLPSWKTIDPSRPCGLFHTKLDVMNVYTFIFLSNQY